MQKPELIVHVGMGKTGTSSIQQTLEINEKKLKRVGIKYLGYDLNYCQGPKLKEQCFKAGEKDESNHAKLKKMLLATLEYNTGKYKKLVVSNERLYHRDQYALLFKGIEAKGYKVTIVSYIRRPDLWARSAHAQWGIKHKATKGPVKTFKQWAVNSRLFYSKHLLAWQELFPHHFIVKNYEEVNDVVADFFSIIGSEYSDVVVSNETVNNEELILWSIYNSRYPGVVLPDKFTSIMNSMRLPSKSDVDIKNLLPNRQDLLDKYEICKDEIKSLNNVFDQYGEPKFNEDLPQLKNEGVDQLKLIQYLTQMIFSMDERIKELEK